MVCVSNLISCGFCHRHRSSKAEKFFYPYNGKRDAKTRAILNTMLRETGGSRKESSSAE